MINGVVDYILAIISLSSITILRFSDQKEAVLGLFSIKYLVLWLGWFDPPPPVLGLRAEVVLFPATNFQPHRIGFRRTQLISLKLQYAGPQRLARMYH